MWDFDPIRTVAIAQRALHFLREAIEISKSVEKDDLCIYSFTRTYGEMMPSKKFIRQVENSLKMIEEYAGGEISIRDDHEVIEPEGNLSSMLMTLNF